MKYNNYNTNNYPRRRPSRTNKIEKTGYTQKLLEEVLTQFLICSLVTITIFATQLLKIDGVDRSLTKLKSAITYSPSLKEVVEEIKEGSNTIIDKINHDNQVTSDSGTEPVILVDDEVF